MGEKLRIYVGGLGSNVQEDDLKKTFTSPQLGTVESLEIIRTKGRSFAYLDFVPASDKGLAKLFSMYNGCMWKGGRLKLEKAREHYMLRLKREWTEDAELESKLSSQNVQADESVHVLQKPKKEDIGKLQLKIFFPKLRKIKPIPLKGTGRHKYSFQRVEVPPLPVHFCDCEEHCGPAESTKRSCNDDCETDAYGVNEDELNLMKSILNKFLVKENSPNTVSNEAELAGDGPVDENEEDQASDEDNLVINIVGQPSMKVASFEDWRMKTTTANQNSLVREPKTSSRSVPEMRESKKGKPLPDKKRKQSVSEENASDKGPPGKKARKGGPHDSIDNSVTVDTQQPETKSGSIQLGYNVASSHKAAWRDLVSKKDSTAFHISDILADHNPEVEGGPTSDPLPAESCISEKDGQENQSSADRELGDLSDGQPTKPSASEDRYARGDAWRKTSSWIQLVADSNKTAFNLSQILPGATFEKQELQQSNDHDFSTLKKGKQHRPEDQISPVEDIIKPQGTANKDTYATPKNAATDVLTKKQNHAGLDGEQSNSDSKETAEKKDDDPAQMNGTDPVPRNRAVGDIVISETCPFMKSATSMKEWAKTKAALSGTHKKKGKGKESVQD